MKILIISKHSKIDTLYILLKPLIMLFKNYNIGKESTFATLSDFGNIENIYFTKFVDYNTVLSFILVNDV